MLLALLAALTLVAYRNSFDAQFTLDSPVMLRNDPRLRDWRHLDLIFTRNYTYPSSTTGGSYRPLTTLSYWANYTLLGNADRPLGYHVVNALLHLAAAALLLYLVAGLGGSLWTGAVAGALFAVHPIATEAVTNIVGRADLLAVVFTLAGLIAHARGRRWLAWGAFACGVLSKESAVVLAPLALLYDWLYRRDELRKNFRHYASHAYVGFLVVFAAWWVGKDMMLWRYGGRIVTSLRNPLVDADALTATLTALKTLGLQLGLLVWPMNLTCDYSTNQVPLVNWPLAGANAGEVGAAVTVLLAALCVALFARANATPPRRLLALAAGWMVFALLPTSNLFTLLPTLMAERYLYLPMAGFCAVVALALTRPPAALRPAVIALAAMLVALGASRTFLRNGDWRDEMRLWSAALRVGPQNAVAHANHAVSLSEQDSTGNLDRAIAETKRAVEIYRPFPQAWANLGRFQLARGDAATAMESLDHATNYDRRLNTERRKQMVNEGVEERWLFDTGDTTVYLLLANVMLKSSRSEQAQIAAEYARHLAPGDARTHAMMAAILKRRGQLADAALAAFESLLIERAQPALVQLLEEIAAELTPGQRWLLTDAGGAPGVNPKCELAVRQYQRALTALQVHFAESNLPDWQRFFGDIQRAAAGGM